MRNMTSEEFESVKKFLLDNPQIANPTKVGRDNNGSIGDDIEICQNEIRIIKNHATFLSHSLGLKNIEDEISQISYFEKNPFYSWDVDYSILEMDTVQNEKFWKNGRSKVGFPFFCPIIMTVLALINIVPTFDDLFHLYTDLYLEVVPEDEMLTYEQRSIHYATDIEISYNTSFRDRNTVGKLVPATQFNGHRYRNEVLRFKKECYINNTYGFPFNEITTEQLLYRIYKVYPSFLRDISTLLRFDYKGMSIFYSSMFDMCYGIDGILEGYIYCNSVFTDRASFFNDIKLSERHPHIKSGKGFRLSKKIQFYKPNIQLYSDDVLDRVIDAVINNKIKDFTEFID